MELNPAIDVTDEQRETVSALLRKHLPDTAVWVYGSRAKWTAGPKSDLDLVVFSTPEQDRQVSSLRDAFEESNLPFRVELLVWARLPESFHREIEREHVVLSGEERAVRTNSEWPSVEIGEIAEIIGGSTPSTKNAANFDGDVPWITPKDLAGSHDRFIIGGSRNLSREGLMSCSAQLVPPGTVLLSTRAPVGYVALAGAEIATNQGFRSLIPKEEARSEFLYYWLKANTEELERHATGTTFQELSGSTLKRIRVPLPPLPEQRAIAHILGALDEKIEANRRMNETLEAMAQAVFKDWFVDFGPTRAKAAGRDPYLPEPLWSLFPDRLVDSELGEIPEGWKVGSLADIAEHIRDQEHPYASPNTLYHHFSIPAFDENRQPKIECGKNIKSQKFRVPPEATLLSRLNPEIERVWLADVNAEDRAVCSTEFLVLQSRRPYGISFPYCLGRSYQFRQAVNSLVTGTSKSHQRAPVDAVLSLPVVLSPESISDEFENIVAAYLKNNRIIRRESLTLSWIRNTLLPKLVSGDIRVPGL